MSTPTVGSLFAGIGGFELGFERAGFRTAWQVELDPYCQRVLAKNFPHAERHADVRECGAGNLRRVDVITAGFPCQDISYAGKGEGITGKRSGLVVEAVRIVRELRPAFVLLENVAALLRRGLPAVLGMLAEIGYDAEWQIVSAADVGAPHLRERIWVLAYPERGRRRQSLRTGAAQGPLAAPVRAESALGPGPSCEDVSDTNSGRTHTEQVRLPRCTSAAHSDRHGAIRPVADAKSERRGETGSFRCDEPAEWTSSSGEALYDPDPDSQLQHRRQRDSFTPGLTGSADVCEAVADAHRGRLEGAPAVRGWEPVPALGCEGGRCAALTNAGESRLPKSEQAQLRGTGRRDEGRTAAECDWWAVEPNVGRVAHGVPRRVDRLRGLGNAVVPQIPEAYAHAIKHLLERAA